MFYECHAVCESSYIEKSDTDKANSFTRTLLALLSLPFFICFVLTSRKESVVCERRGHDVAVSYTLPVCDPCATTVGNVTRPKTAKQLMAKVPNLNDLLTYYPRLELTVERTATQAPNRR